MRLIFIAVLLMISTQGICSSHKKEEKKRKQELLHLENENLKSKLSTYNIVLGCRDAGMFSIFNDVLALVDGYERGCYKAVEVNFEKEGLYFSPQYGENWWLYYCEPICVGAKQQEILRLIGDTSLSRQWDIERKMHRRRAKLLIDRYIKPRREIIDKVEEFERQNFTGRFVISVHYRGTDKISEAPRISYKKAADTVESVIQKISASEPWTIFIATDEELFLEYMRLIFGTDHICFRKETTRSFRDDGPIHLNRENDPYKIGEDAIMDCLLLARGDHLVRTSSNLSLWATYFNPDMPVTELSRRHGQ